MKITKEGRKEKKIIIEEKKMHKQKVKEKIREKGITLIALVVTIIILLILAGVTLNIALGQNGLFSRAQNAADRYKLAQENETKMIEELDKQLGNLTSNQPPSPPEEKVPTTVQDAKSKEYKFEETTTVTDENGNKVVVPGKFRISSESGDTVQDGIIIEDNEGNQFVWIPVSNIDNTETENEQNLITKNNGETVEITLGRYSFSTTDGTPELKQAGKDYEKTVTVDSYYQETSEHPNGGTPAKNLKAFVESVEKNHGYYIGRYEASFKSGTSTEDYKPAVKKSTSNSSSQMNTTLGTLWNFITQGDASTVSKNMYKTNVDDEAKYVESDLVNSYAWDTAIVYIQKMGNDNYANATSATNGNTNTLKNTGETGDEKCHIYDMSGNLREWTTEYSANDNYTYKSPCVDRGGSFSDSIYTAYRDPYDTARSFNFIGFRPLVYLGSSDG